MKYSILFLLFFCALILSSFGQKQKSEDEFVSATPVCNCGKIAAIDPINFTVDMFAFKREPSKRIKRKLKLGVQGHCIFVIDSLGKVQPYKIKNWIFSIQANGMASWPFTGNCIKGDCNRDIMSFFCKMKIGSKFFFDTVVVEDNRGKEIKSFIEPLTIVKIK